ncbi:MAG: ATP-binding protein, partial [Planctomycetota bacterium]
GEAMKLKASLEASEEARETAEARLREAEEQRKEVQEAKTLVESEKAASVQALRECEIERDAAKEEGDTLKERIREMEVAREELEAGKFSLEAKLQEFEMDRDAARAESFGLQKQLEEADKAKDEVVTALHRSEGECTALKAECAGLNERLNAAEEARQSVEAEKSDLVTSLREAEKERDTARAEGADLKGQLEQAEQARQAAQAEMESLSLKVKEYEKARDEARAKILMLHERMQEVENVKKAAEHQQTDFTAQLKKLEMDRDSERAKNMNLQQRLQEASESSGEKRRELEEKLRQAEEAREARENENLQLQEKIQDFEEGRETIQSEIAALQEQVKSAEDAWKQAESESHERQVELEKVREEFSSEKHTLEECLKEAENQKLESETERHELEEKLGEAESAYTASGEERKELEEKLKQAEEARRAAEEELRLLKENQATEACIESETYEPEAGQGEETVKTTTVEEPAYAVMDDDSEALEDEVQKLAGEDFNPILTPEAVRDPNSSIADFSSLKAGDEKGRGKWFDIRELIKGLCDRLGSGAAQKGLELKYLVADDVPAQLEGDPLALKQVLTHLLDNSVNYTEKGGIRIKADLAGWDGHLVRIHLFVQDTGQGIPEEKKKIINAFFGDEQCSSDAVKNTVGMGLMTVNSLLARLGGDLVVESEEGKGSSFRLSVPMKSMGGAPASAQPSETFGFMDLASPGEKAVETQEPEVEGDKSPGEACILFIDDELNPHEELVTMMDGFGIPLEKACNTREGRDALRSREYDIVFMVINIFSMGEVAEVLQLRKKLDYTNMPIIAVLDEPTGEEEIFLLSMGLNKCIASPYAAEEIRAVISEFIPLEAPVAEQQEGVEEKPGEEPEVTVEETPVAEAQHTDGLILSNPMDEIETEPSLKE